MESAINRTIESAEGSAWYLREVALHFIIPREQNRSNSTLFLIKDICLFCISVVMPQLCTMDIPFSYKFPPNRVYNV